MIDLLDDLLQSQLNLQFSKHILDDMCHYWEAVKNAPFNLTAIKDDRKAALLHFADSLAPLHYLEIPTGASLIDVGTGGGFPSVPLALAREDLRVTAIDSTKKKIDFIAAHTSPGLLELFHTRAEDLAHDPDSREQFDFACARAVAPSNVLLEYLSPFVKPNGSVIIYKSELSPEELATADSAAQILHMQRSTLVRYTLQDEDVFARTLLCYRKTAATPWKYPRRQVRSNPLGSN